MTFLYCAYSPFLLKKLGGFDSASLPFKFGTAVKYDERLDRMNFGWKVKGRLRCARLALCEGWYFPTLPVQAGNLADSTAKEAAERLFGIWSRSSDFEVEMRELQKIHLPQYRKFEGNGVGELRLISFARWSGFSFPNDFSSDDLLKENVISKIAFLALMELAQEVGLKELPRAA